MINLRKPLQYFILILIPILAMATTVVRAQSPNPPVPIELMFGHEKLDFQAILKRNFTPTSKFSFLAISVFSENYDQEEELGNSIVLPFQVNYALGKKGFAVAVGGEANSIAGFSTTVGLEHAFANRKILAITLLNYFLNEEHDIKLFGLYEYRPALNETWSFYSRLQFMYNHSSSENLHNRSFLYTRAGLKKGPLSFGLGANWDRYGPQRTTKTNFGLFTKWDF